MMFWSTIAGVLLLLMSNTIFVDKLEQCYAEPQRFCVLIKVN